jgi:hypothetical protein
MLGYAEPPREQPALASLESELSDSASLGYLRRRPLGGRRRRVQSLALLRKIKMDTRNGYPFLFGGACGT